MNKEEEKPVIRSQTNGPHGLGNPYDKRLRKVELNVVIKNKVREAAKERCVDYINVFKDCARKNGMLLPFFCRKENIAQLECLRIWFEDEKLNEQMKEEYLEERSYYRATGVPKNGVGKRNNSY